MIRQTETDADLEAYASVWNAITPREPRTAATIRKRIEQKPERLYVIAEDAGRAVGVGFAG